MTCTVSEQRYRAALKDRRMLITARDGVAADLEPPAGVDALDQAVLRRWHAELEAQIAEMDQEIAAYEGRRP